MNDPWWKTLLIDAGSTLFAAAFATCVVAQIKAWRVNARLSDIADILEKIRIRTEVSMRGAGISEAKAQSEEQIKEIKEELEKSSEGALRLSRYLRMELRKIERDVDEAHHKLFGTFMMEILDHNPRISETHQEIRILEDRIRDLTAKIYFLEFIKP